MTLQTITSLEVAEQKFEVTQVELSTKAIDLKGELSFKKKKLQKAKWELSFEREQL